MDRDQVKRIVVVGGVAAGTSAAAKARRNDETAEITIYDMDRDISYSGCGLPYFISGIVPSLDVLVPRDAAYFWNQYRIDVKVRHEVLAIDPDAKKVRVRNLEDGSEFVDRYDTLVLATGANPVILPLPGAEKAHVFTLKNPSDAAAIKDYLDKNAPRTAVVIGSGFIGLEMVESLTEAGLAVQLVEKLPAVCPFLDPDMAPYLQEYLEAKGIAIYTGRTAVSIDDRTVALDDGTELDADLVLVAVGIRPNVKLAESAGVSIGKTGAIAVNEYMRTNIPHIYACGDCAESYSNVVCKVIYRPLGSTANKTGRIAGDAITGGDLSFRGISGTGIFRVFEMSVAATGLSEQEARDDGFDVLISHNIKPDKPEYFGGREMVIKSIADRQSGRLLGVQIVGYEGVDKRIDVFVTAIAGRLAAADLFHLDLAYAPPFSTTKDPVMYSGMILENALNRGREVITADTLAQLDNPVIVDVRQSGQYAAGHVEDAVSMPLEALRDSWHEEDMDRPVVTYCNKGTSGNAAQNVLINRGCKQVYCLSGGHRQYQHTVKARNKKQD